MNVAEIIEAIKMLNTADRLMLDMWVKGHFKKLEEIQEALENE